LHLSSDTQITTASDTTRVLKTENRLRHSPPIGCTNRFVISRQFFAAALSLWSGVQYIQSKHNNLFIRKKKSATSFG